MPALDSQEPLLDPIERAVLQRAVDAHPSAAALLGASLRVELCNDRWVQRAREAGLPTEESAGATAVDALNGLRSVAEEDLESLRTRWRVGERWFELAAHVCWRRPLLVHVACEDVTLQVFEEQRSAAEAVRIATESAAAMESRRLLALTQEIRNPLMGMIGLTDTLLEADELSALQRLALLDIRAAGRIVIEMLNQTVERGPEGTVAPPPPDEAVSLRGLVHDAVRAFRDKAPKGVRLTWEAEAVWLDLGKARLRHVLNNLLENAAKATREGAISIEAEVWRLSGQDLLHVSVSDTGPGVPPDRRKAIFEAPPGGGPGGAIGGPMGLAVVSSIVRAMGGSVRVEDGPRGGAKFIVRVPVRISAPPVSVDEADVTIVRGVKVLVLEDSPPVARALTRMLEADDHHTTVVGTLADARETLAAETFDMVLLDRQLPDGESDPLVAEIRALDEKRCTSTLVVPITAAVSPAARDALMALGVRTVLEKPFRLDALRAILAEHMGVTPTSPRVRPESP